MIVRGRQHLNHYAHSPEHAVAHTLPVCISVHHTLRFRGSEQTVPVGLVAESQRVTVQLQRVTTITSQSIRDLKV